MKPREYFQDKSPQKINPIVLSELYSSLFQLLHRPTHRGIYKICTYPVIIFAPICPLGFCRGRESLQNLCEQIPGDALLYSMFKENAEPVKCPLKGTY